MCSSCELKYPTIRLRTDAAARNVGEDHQSATVIREPQHSCSKAGQGTQTEMSAKTGSDNNGIFPLYGTSKLLVYGQSYRGRYREHIKD